MDRRFGFSLETRIEAARLFDAGFSYTYASAELSMSKYTLRHWHDQYLQGRLLDCDTMVTKKYSSDMKIAAVEKFLAGSSKTEVVVEFQISNRSVLNKWVKIYQECGPDGLVAKRVGRPRTDSVGESLEEENDRLRMENEILKKWVALAQQEDRRLSGQ